MKNKKYYFIGLFLVSLLPNFVFGMIINEIMYDVSGTDSGREWIEIYNNTSGSIDFSNWKLLESGVNHSVKLISGDAVISAGGYAIIADNDAKFMLDNPDFEGTLFDSVFSLANTGEALILVDPTGNKINEISFTDSLGAKGDGNSLQLNEGFLISAEPTIGFKNKTKSSDPPSSASTTTVATSTSAHSSPKPIIKPKEEVDFELSVGRDRVGSIKSPIIFEAYVNQEFDSGRARFLWNFGDGKQEKGRKVEHYYKHPGIYNVVLNSDIEGLHAVARSVVSIFKPDVDILSTQDGLVFSNLSASELNIGGWKLKNEEHSIKFTFPIDTIIAPNSEIIFDRELFFKKEQVLGFENIIFDLVFPNGDKVVKKSDIISE